jgi:hypothetical protein
MKIIALLLLFLGVLLILAVAAMSVFLFAMAFDAPGSADKPGVWLGNSLIFLPLLLFIALLIYAFIAYQSGQYTRAVWLGSVFVAVAAGGWAWLRFTSLRAHRKLQEVQAREAEDARRYPTQRFLRPFEGGADTILVFPSRIVAYRMPRRGDMPFAYSGPVGDLNEARDAIVIAPAFDGRIRREEFGEFVDEAGRRLTEVYAIR